MPAYVTLPGTSGNYFSTPDMNLLDADLAHQQQASSWLNGGGANARVQSTDLTPVFGDYHSEWTCASGRTFCQANSAAGTDGAPVTGGSVVSASISLAHSGASIFATGGKLRFQLRQWTAAGASITTTTLEDVNDPAGATWHQLSGTLTLDATAAFATLQIVALTDGTNTAGTEKVYWDAACIRSGSDATFVPSLRIVGDLDIEAKFALDDYTPATTNTILDCLNSNDGYRLRHTTGDLIEIAYGNGSSTRAQTSSATGLTDGEAHVIKVTVDQSSGAVVYYIDGVQHDTDTMTTGAGQPDINDLVVGANAAASANWTDGDLYYVIVRDGISGPIVAKFDADDWVGV